MLPPAVSVAGLRIPKDTAAGHQEWQQPFTRVDFRWAEEQKRPRWLIPAAGVVLGGAAGCYAGTDTSTEGVNFGCQFGAILGGMFGGLLGLIVESNLP